MQRYRTGNIENGGKMVVLLELIELSVLMGEKILVFRLVPHPSIHTIYDWHARNLFLMFSFLS